MIDTNPINPPAPHSEPAKEEARPAAPAVAPDPLGPCRRAGALALIDGLAATGTGKAKLDACRQLAEKIGTADEPPATRNEEELAATLEGAASLIGDMESRPDLLGPVTIAKARTLLEQLRPPPPKVAASGSAGKKRN